MTWQDFKKTNEYLTTDVFEFINSDGTEYAGIINDNDLIKVRVANNVTEVEVMI